MLSNEESLRDWSLILTNAAWFMWMKGSYGTAYSLARKAFMARERIVGRDDKSTLLNLKVVVLGYQGKYSEAKKLNRRALEGIAYLLH